MEGVLLAESDEAPSVKQAFAAARDTIAESLASTGVLAVVINVCVNHARRSPKTGMQFGRVDACANCCPSPGMN